MQRTNDIDVKIEEGRFIAQHIKGAKFIEFSGNDHLFWVGNTKEVLDQIRDFVKNINLCKIEYKSVLRTVLSGQVSPPLKSNNRCDFIENLVIQYGGSVINLNKERFVVLFDAPGKAVNCGLVLRKMLCELALASVMAVYVKFGSFNGDNFFSSKDDYVFESIFSRIRLNQILVTQTVKNLLTGIDLEFYLNDSIIDFESSGLFKIYSVDEKVKGNHNEISNYSSLSKYDPFLEDVLDVINKYIVKDDFGVETLSSEIGVSQRQLQRKVKELTNKSPSQLITLMKLQKAKRIMLSSNDNISEVAFNLGFSSLSYFTKCFKNEFGISPSFLLNKMNKKI